MISSRLSSILFASILLGSILFSQLVSADVSQTRSETGEPEISITIDRTTEDVDTSPDSSGEMEFTITVIVYIPSELPEETSVILDLKAKAWWWEVSEIEEIAFTRNIRERSFPITVTASSNSTAGKVVDLEIDGSWTYYNSTEWCSIEKLTLAKITALPFFNVFIGSNFPVKYADVGDWTEFTFNITNRANMDVNITLQIEKDSSHLFIKMEQKNLSFKKGETKVVTFRARQEPSRSRGNTIHVYAKVNEDPESQRWDLPLLFFTEPNFGTFFYERNFIRLILIILVIVSVAIGLFFWERTKKEEKVEEFVEEPLRGSRPRLSRNIPRK
jgi:hypothetical protein